MIPSYTELPPSAAMTAALSHTLDGAQRESNPGRYRTSEATDDSRRQQKPPTSCETHTLPHYAYPTANSVARLRASKLFVPSNTSSSSSSWLSRSKSRLRRTSASQKYCSNVAAADPDYITQLWNNVRAYGAETESLKGRGEKGAPFSTGTLTSPRSSNQKPKKGPVAKVSDLDFETTVLTPYGITIEGESLTQSFYNHFSLSKLPNNRTERFNVYKKKIALNIWLEPNDDHAKRIQEEFCAMKDYRCTKAEFAAYTLQEMLLDERRYPMIVEPSEILMAPVRTLQLVQKPIPGTWKAPTQLTSSEKHYEWDIRPDCAYYISLRVFPPSFRHDVRKFVSVVQDRACCPYLTIEFKKHLEAPQATTNRVAIASAIALYNRWHLKNKALQKLNIAGYWPEDHKNQLRHYSITFAGAAWELWYTIPKTYDVWSGCTMFQMKFGDCCNAKSVVLLLSILNDIHYWGLAVHGKSCLVDIGTLVKGNTGRVSWLSKRIENLEIGTA
ncbi:hypothetical protein O1611_g5726 [Lasiodiplodia mahajangana]|uniref:Uncharacterized protein n=1 Tax=Lasiodiplodia mahajangana TaxID=1108764 RepID=A0ACC2JK68_9PEZI|nr:hypothetical protein O1611_g5726 [Lasiodiplodia mahajangana]